MSTPRSKPESSSNHAASLIAAVRGCKSLQELPSITIQISVAVLEKKITSKEANSILKEVKLRKTLLREGPTLAEPKKKGKGK
jgi:hypothetical protein